jgi:ABC-type lipoprotein release transport system permease subunit
MRVAGNILGEGLRLVGIGTLAGFLAALGTTRFLRALLYEVEPTSAREFGIAIAVLVAVTFLATLLPARRAARTHPATVLQGE